MNRAAPSKMSSSLRWKQAVDQGAKEAANARVLVLQIDSGRIMASAHLEEAGRSLATPGSTLKPLLLYYALDSKRWNPEHRIACSRQMRIGGHQLNCSHPMGEAFDAEQALTWSCNAYFAELAEALSPEELHRALSVRGLLAATGLTALESVAEFREPLSKEQIQLTVLGVEGIRVTLPELAEAYRSLAIDIAAHSYTKAARIVHAGLADSASFGMAGAASLGGVPVAGKTGTASAETGGLTHGWFVGLAPAQSPQVVIAIYLPSGRGTDAAQLAAEILALSPLRKP